MPSAHPIRPKLSAAAVAIGLLAGCSMPQLPKMPDLPKIPGIYRIDIQQGNVVTQDMLDRLQKGMEKRKVRLVLGTPLITDTFHQDRWDYIYSFQKGGGSPTLRNITLRFKKGRLASIEGDVKPAATRHQPKARKETVVTVPPRKEEGGILEALTPGFLKKDTAVAKQSTPAAPAAEPGTPAEPNTRTASAAQPPTATKAKDRSLLRRLFSGFGGAAERADGAAPGDQPSQAPTQAKGESGAPTATGSTPNDAQATADNATAKSEDDGFFTRLLKRFKLPKKNTDAATDETVEPPPAQPPAE